MLEVGREVDKDMEWNEEMSPLYFGSSVYGVASVVMQTRLGILAFEFNKSHLVYLLWFQPGCGHSTCCRSWKSKLLGLDRCWSLALLF